MSEFLESSHSDAGFREADNDLSRILPPDADPDSDFYLEMLSSRLLSMVFAFETLLPAGPFQYISAFLSMRLSILLQPKRTVA